jgi:hypothetical protein
MKLHGMVDIGTWARRISPVLRWLYPKSCGCGNTIFVKFHKVQIELYSIGYHLDKLFGDCSLSTAGGAHDDSRGIALLRGCE